MDKNVLCHFMYLNDYFYKENNNDIFVKTRYKINKGLDFQNLFFKRSFHGITFIIMIK